ncbi:MAG: PTS sugar transporter subunit IIA [Spirochaetales bacterium]|nr:PTS sugar transporter subunit IIA [Spirochaetales bacterium]
MMNLQNVLSEDLCCVLKEDLKNEALFIMLQMISNKLSLPKDVADQMTRNIFYREQLMSTGIGLGIAIPHIRFEGVSEPIVAVGINEEGIPDYISIDDDVIQIVAMIIVGKDQHKEHIRLLSQVVSLLKQKEIKEKLLFAKDPHEIYTIMTGK